MEGGERGEPGISPECWGLSYGVDGRALDGHGLMEDRQVGGSEKQVWLWAANLMGHVSYPRGMLL